jgi:hypothetical protein
MVPAEQRGVLKDWRMLVINDGIFQAIGVISFGMFRSMLKPPFNPW